MTNLLFYLAVAPPLFLMYLIYVFDKRGKDRREVSIVVFVLGCLTVIPSIAVEEIMSYLQPTSVIGDSSLFPLINVRIFMMVLIQIALIEEFFKFLVVRRYAYFQDEFKAPYDGIIYAVIASLGFALIENLMYVFNYGAEEPMLTAVARMFSAIPAHGLMGVFMGYYIGKAKFDKINQDKLIIKGFVAAVILHTLYDYFLFLPSLRLDLALLTLVIAFVLAFNAIKESRNLVPANDPVKFRGTKKKGHMNYRSSSARASQRSKNVKNDGTCLAWGADIMTTMRICHACGSRRRL